MSENSSEKRRVQISDIRGYTKYYWITFFSTWPSPQEEKVTEGELSQDRAEHVVARFDATHNRWSVIVKNLDKQVWVNLIPGLTEEQTLAAYCLCILDYCEVFVTII